MATKEQGKEPKKSSTILKDRALIGKRNRRRGHAYEVKIVKELKEITQITNKNDKKNNGFFKKWLRKESTEKVENYVTKTGGRDRYFITPSR